MGICWYCYWGWSEPVGKVYEAALKALDGNENPLHYGPSHIVWDDENFDDHSVDFCLGRCGDEYEYPPEEIEVVRKSLLALKAIPEDQRCVEPDDYDGEHPENYPPKVKMFPKDEIREMRNG